MRMRELRRKEVINVSDGGRLGFVGDVELHLPEGQTAALIVFGPARFFGLFGKGEEYYIPWDCIRDSEMTSFSSTSLFSAGTRLWSGNGGKNSDNDPVRRGKFGIYPKFTSIF